MSLITDNWRLKVLAVGLAVLMLGAVDFSQNPPKTRSLTVGLTYYVPSGLVLINPPSKVTVTIGGLADLIASVTPDNLVAVADATNVSPGPAVKLNVKVTGPTGVNIQNPDAIHVDIDNLQAKQLPVTVKANPAPTWSITTAVAVCGQSPPCVVTFTGPAIWEVNLQASVAYGAQVDLATIDEPNEPVQLQNSLGVLDLSSVRTIPAAGLDINAVSIHIEAKPGSTSTTVPLVDAPPSQPTPSGYRVTGITVDPGSVIITGDATILRRIQRIVLPPVDLSGHVSDFTIQVAIKYPDGVAGSAAFAKITYSISPNPTVSPSP
ncbi:MAG: YbbR-like domain-containing protein [Candidatus Dormibacterales bacterium]